MIIPTKLHIPRSRMATIPRPRLDARLHDGLECELTLITAPAGYGKTTVLSEWADQVEAAVAWVSLDADDNDHTRFWRHTVAALQGACPDVDAQAVLRFAAEDRTGNSVVAALINALHRVSGPIVLVWDDFHHIEGATLTSNINYLLERLPQHVHVYIASRTLPALQLTRIHARSGLNRLDASDLRFESTEIEAFFRHCSQLSLPPHVLGAIEARTEGWVAGMRLAALSWDETTDYETVIQLLTGTERDISAYFFEEVLSRQSAPLRHFLVQTSVLDRMNGDLCAAVTGIADSAIMLEQLEQVGLFLAPLDDRREWYRYHHLFQQFLQEQLLKREPETSLALHLSAGRWFEQNGDWDDAIRHYLASSSYDDALQLIAKLPPQWLKAEWASLHAWLSVIPDAVLIARPRLYMMLIASMFLIGELAQATAKLSWAKAELEAGNIAEPQATAFRIGMEALHGLRAYIERNFADAARHLRQYMSLDPTGAFMSGIGTDDERFMPFWDVYTYIGGPQQAERFLGDLLQLWSLVEHQLFVAPIHSGYGKAMYELNRLSEAERYFRKVLAAGRTYTNPTLLTSASLWLARIQAALGNDEKAARMIRSLLEHVDEARFSSVR